MPHLLTFCKGIMNTGSKKSSFPPDQAIDRLCAAMAGGNFEIEHKDSNRISFRHGMYLTQTATMLPKRGAISVRPNDAGSLVQYEIEVYGFAKYWLMFFAVLFCWLIFPPIIVFRAMKHHPERLMKNLLQAV